MALAVVKPGKLFLLHVICSYRSVDSVAYLFKVVISNCI